MTTQICPHCKMEIKIRNPSGFCDHLYYPDLCDTCKNNMKCETCGSEDCLEMMGGC